MPMQPQAVMDEKSGMDDESPSPGMDPRKQEQEQETVEIPLSALPAPPKPGAMIQMKVISIDQNAKCVYAVAMSGEPGGPPGQTPGGSDSLAAEFNQQPKY